VASFSDTAAMLSGPADVERIVTVLDKADEPVIGGIGRIITERNDFRNEVERLQMRLAEEIQLRVNAEAKLATGERVFGDILTQTGEARPNRKKLLPSEVAQIRNMKRAGYRQSQLAEMFDVNPATISRIVRKVYHTGVAA
jgi:hypothetical protein